MKVHPVPGKRNIGLRYDVASVLALASSCRQKKLRRLPHIFEKVLELPFHPDAEVSIEETAAALRFIAATDEIGGGGIRADAVEICPGVTKIIIRGSGVVDLSGTELGLDLWRFRLPASTRPELVSAAYDGRELVVTVPKGAEEEEEDGGSDDGGGRLVFVRDSALSHVSRNSMDTYNIRMCVLFVPLPKNSCMVVTMPVGCMCDGSVSMQCRLLLLAEPPADVETDEY